MPGGIAALLRYLSREALRLGVAEHTYVVGGAVRNHLIGAPIKDLDLVVDSVELGNVQDSGWFARQLQRALPVRSNLVTNQYGVAILTVSAPWNLDGHEMQGEVLEIANARRESYGGEAGRGYKPHLVEPSTILDDLQRRDFTVNTLLWRLADLSGGHEGAAVLDLLGAGLPDLEKRLLRTPLDPDRTFSDDPTRMLRAIKFAIRHELTISMPDAILRNAMKLTQMPWDAVRKILVDDLLQGPTPRRSVPLLRELGLNEPILQLLREEPGFHAGVSRGLAGADVLLLLDLWDLEWHLKGSPAGLVRHESIPRLREILETNPAAQERFMAALRCPPIDQVRLFERHGLRGRARQGVAAKARELLLLDPALADDPTGLEAEVSKALYAQSDSTP